MDGAARKGEGVDGGLEVLDASLPGALPAFDRTAATGRYVLGRAVEDHCGDNLKAVALPHGRVGLAVVDPASFGAEGAAASVRLLAVLRTQLEAGSTAAEAVACVDGYAARSAPARGAALAAAVLDQRDGTVECALAGHPAPLVVTAEDVHRVRLAPSRPLGLAGRPATATLRLAVGDVLVLGTNGLLTARDGGVGDGADRLARALAGLPPRPPGLPPGGWGDTVAAHVLTRLQDPYGYADDVALLLAERLAAPGRFTVASHATAEEADAVVAGFAGWLDGLGAGLLEHLTLRQALREVTTNVVRHAYATVPAPRQGGLEVDAEVDAAGLLRVRVRDGGRWRPTQTDGSGGLARAGGLVDSLRITRGPGGSEVVLEQALVRPVPLLRSQGPAAPETALALDLGTGRLVVRGAVAHEQVGAFRDAVHRASCGGTQDAVVDLGAVTRLAGPAVLVLVDYRVRARGCGAELDVVAPLGSIADQVLALADLPHRTAGPS